MRVEKFGIHICDDCPQSMAVMSSGGVEAGGEFRAKHAKRCTRHHAGFRDVPFFRNPPIRPRVSANWWEAVPGIIGNAPLGWEVATFQIKIWRSGTQRWGDEDGGENGDKEAGGGGGESMAGSCN